MTDKNQRRLMLAHVLDLMAIHTRNGLSLSDAADLIEHAARIALGPWPEQDYRSALNLMRVSPEDIDASVAECTRHVHPADSLMGRVAKMRNDAHSAVQSATGLHKSAEHFGGKDALNDVLDLLEGEGRNARTAHDQEGT